MIPILFDKTETTFTSNGIGRLRDCTEAIVVEERNGVYELDFSYPVDGANYDLIQVGRIVGVTHDESTDIQPFDIVSYTKPIDGIVTFHCVHISYRQSYLTATGSNINSLADAFTLLGTAEPSNPFSYWTDKTSTGYLACADDVPHSVRQMLGGIEGSILDAYGGEYEWDKWTVKLWSARGQYRDFSIRYGVNMLDYNEEYDSSGCYSSCIPYWTNGTTTIVGDKQTNGGVNPSGREQCIPLDVSKKFEGQPTKAQVEAMGLSVMNGSNPTVPSQNIKVSFVRLQDMGEYADYQNLLQCKLCDTINVIFPDFNSSSTFKIVKTVWNVLAGKYDEMELGDLSISLSEALGITDKSDSRIVTEWTLISTVTGNTSTSLDLSDFGEILVTCQISAGSSPRSGSTNIPVSLLSNNYQEWSIGYSSSVYTATFGALFRLSLTNFTPQWAYASGTNYSSTAQWNVYGLKVKNLVNGGGGGTDNYESLVNKPQINNVPLIGNKTSSQIGVADAVHTHTVSQITNFPVLSTVATSGDYNDLNNTPTLATVATSGDYNDLSNLPVLATVATSGNYNDLSNKPTIPTVNNATLTIQKNSTDVATFTANASTNVTADISVPTKVSDITNDSGFISTPNIPYCTCATAAGTKAKTTTIVSGTFTEADLVTGAQVLVKFTNANSIANPTLKIGSTTAKTIKRYGTTAPSTSAASSWNAGSVIMFTYDGTYWQMTDFNNTTYSSMTEAEYEAGTGTSARIITPARLKDAIQYWDAVTSVNSKTGAVTLTASDVGALADTYTAPVTSVNTKTGAVTLTASDVGALPSNTTYVSSVNGNSGAVTVSDLSISSDGDLDGATYTIVDGNTSYLFPSSDRFTTANVGLLTYIQSLAVNGNLFPTTATGNMYNLVLDGDDIAYDANTSVNAKIDTIIASGGEPNAINTISVNNVNQTITNKNVNIETVIIGSTSDYTPTQVKSAIDSGKNVIITYTHSTYGNIVGYSFNYSQAYNALVSNTIAYYNNSYYLFELVGTLTNNAWSCEVTQIAQSSDIPTVPTNVSDFTNDAGYITSETGLGKTTWTPTSGSSYSNYGGCYYEKYGRVVHVHVGVSGLTTRIATNIYTLPSGYRPSSPVYAHGTGGAWDNIGYLEISTAGVVTVRSQGTYCGADVTFLA